MKILDLRNENSWPTEVLNFLEEKAEIFRAWKTSSGQVSATEYDEVVNGLLAILRTDYVLRGYHCTRLTDTEIQNIVTNGMSLPSASMLSERLEAIVQTGAIESQVARHLLTNNEAHNTSRAGMIWFCFFPPYKAGQGGIERFFRSWGGEALYNSHEDDPLSGPIITTIGRPCIIEAYVPIASLEYYGGLESIVIGHYLRKRGVIIDMDLDHEDRAKQPIPASNIVRIIKFPEKDFIDLTKCDKWKPPLEPSANPEDLIEKTQETTLSKPLNMSNSDKLNEALSKFNKALSEKKESVQSEEDKVLSFLKAFESTARGVIVPAFEEALEEIKLHDHEGRVEVKPYSSGSQSKGKVEIKAASVSLHIFIKGLKRKRLEGEPRIFFNARSDNANSREVQAVYNFFTSGELETGGYISIGTESQISGGKYVLEDITPQVAKDEAIKFLTILFERLEIVK
ncbi:hypothetical protein [Spirosoma aerophilum]